jgi:hypothetical protein
MNAEALSIYCTASTSTDAPLLTAFTGTCNSTTAHSLEGQIIDHDKLLRTVVDASRIDVTIIDSMPPYVSY